jgi:hypothetical protein
MVGTKVIETTDDKHTSLQGFGLTGQVPATTGQPGQPLAKGGVQSFNKSGVNLTPALTGLQQLDDLLMATLNNPSDNSQAALGPLFDDLDNSDFRPGPQAAAPRLTVTRNRAAKSVVDGTDITDQPIHRHQQRATQGHRSHLVHQTLDQAQVALGTNNPTQPQSARNHHRHRHPDRPTLRFDFDFIGLHLLQIQLTLPDYMLMHGLAMLTGPLPPSFDRPLVKPEGDYNRLDWTTISQQGQHQQHRHRIGFQPVENSPFAHTKGLLTDVTITPFFFMTMDANIATSTLSSCRTLKIRAKYLFEVHWHLLLVVVTQKYAREPLFF